MYTIWWLLIPTTVVWLSWRWLNRQQLALAAALPGPPALPMVGNALLFMVKPEETLKVITDMLLKYGEYVRFWLGPELNVVVSNPADIRLLLSSNKLNVKGPMYDYLKPFIGNGILSGGSSWRLHRKIVTPSYSKGAVHHFSEIFNREARELALQLSKKDPRETFDVYYDVVRCTTQCVCQTLMGLNKKDSQNIYRLDEVVLKTQEIYDFIFTNITKWWLRIPLVYWLTGRRVQERYLKTLLIDMATDIARKRKKALEKDDGAETMSAVDKLILSQALSEGEIILETITMFTTSQEASAKIIAAILLFLAHLPDWQDAVYNEIIEVLGPEDGDVSEAELKRLKYLDAVYNEVLRYLPIAAFIQRTVGEKITINNGAITLPRGTKVTLPIHALHRDPRYWPRPDQARPGRFLPEEAMTRDPNAFVPFSLGPMDCLGRVYARSLIKTLVVRTLRRVQLSASGRLEDLPLQVAISVKFARGYNLRCRPRDPGTLVA